MTESPAKQDAAKARAERLKRALKANLKRRKAQGRTRTSSSVKGTKNMEA